MKSSTSIAFAPNNDREGSRWKLLRVWHLEAMECVIESPTLASFARTSYVSTPERWRELPPRQVATWVEQLLHAHYRIRAATLRPPGVDERMVPFAFDFELITRTDIPAAPGVRSDPWMFPCANRNPRLTEIASNELDALLQDARPGIESRCYRDAFEVFRIDEDDSWHIIDWRERPSLFASRYEGKWHIEKKIGPNWRRSSSTSRSQRRYSV